MSDNVMPVPGAAGVRANRASSPSCAPRRGPLGGAGRVRSLVLLFGVLGLLGSLPAPAAIVASAYRFGSGVPSDQDEGTAVAFAQAADDTGSASAQGLSTGVMYLYAGSRKPDAFWTGRVLFEDTFRLSGVPFGPLTVRALFSVSGELEAQRMDSHTPAGEARVSAGIYSPKAAPGVTHAEYSAAVTAPDALFGTSRRQVNELLSLTLGVLSNQPFDVSFVLTVEAAHNDGRAGFTNSGVISFELPPGATITSSGGYQQTAPIPLPPTLGLLASALALAAPLGRGARRTAPPCQSARSRRRRRPGS